MPLYHLVLIAIIQGLTEFLPVSSSAHLILLPGLTGLEDQGPTIDVAAHVGTLFAVIIYFWPDVRLALQGFPKVMRGQINNSPSSAINCVGNSDNTSDFGRVDFQTHWPVRNPKVYHSDRLGYAHLRHFTILGGPKGPKNTKTGCFDMA